jgi:hypothetical protein
MGIGAAKVEILDRLEVDTSPKKVRQVGRETSKMTQKRGWQFYWCPAGSIQYHKKPRCVSVVPYQALLQILMSFEGSSIAI